MGLWKRMRNEPLSYDRCSMLIHLGTKQGKACGTVCNARGRCRGGLGTGWRERSWQWDAPLTARRCRRRWAARASGLRRRQCRPGQHAPRHSLRPRRRAEGSRSSSSGSQRSQRQVKELSVASTAMKKLTNATAQRQWLPGHGYVWALSQQPWSPAMPSQADAVCVAGVARSHERRRWRTCRRGSPAGSSWSWRCRRAGLLDGVALAGGQAERVLAVPDGNPGPAGQRAGAADHAVTSRESLRSCPRQPRVPGIRQAPTLLRDPAASSASPPERLWNHTGTEQGGPPCHTSPARTVPGNRSAVCRTRPVAVCASPVWASCGPGRRARSPASRRSRVCRRDVVQEGFRKRRSSQQLLGNLTPRGIQDISTLSKQYKMVPKKSSAFQQMLEYTRQSQESLRSGERGKRKDK